VEERERLRLRDEAMLRYNRALRDYAVRRAEWRDRVAQGESTPEPDYPPLQPELKTGAEVEIPEKGSARAARLRHFSNFVNAHLGVLVSMPQYILQVAYSHTQETQVSKEAERIFAFSKEPWLRRSPRPPPPPLRPQCPRTLIGHSRWVTSVSVCADGHRAVSGSKDKTLRVWDLETGECLHTLVGHNNDVNCVSVSANNRCAVSGSLDNTLRVWDIETGECLRTLVGHSGGVLGVNVCPDGRRAVSGSSDNTLRVWDLESGECLRTIEGHNDQVNLSPDGCLAFSAYGHKPLWVWELITGRCLATYYAGSGVTSIVFSPSTERIAREAYDSPMHFLTPVNFPPSGPAILTAAKPGQARCPLCARDFPPLLETTSAIRSFLATLRPGQSPCLDLPASAFSDPRLLTTCPHCAQPLKFNPFFVKRDV